MQRQSYMALNDCLPILISMLSNVGIFSDWAATILATEPSVYNYFILNKYPRFVLTAMNLLESALLAPRTPVDLHPIAI